jgi:hypothetical protein
MHDNDRMSFYVSFVSIIHMVFQQIVNQIIQHMWIFLPSLASLFWTFTF